MFLKITTVEIGMNEGCKVTCAKIFFIFLFKSQCLFDIYHISVTIKNSDNLVKRECFEKWGVLFFSK